MHRKKAADTSGSQSDESALDGVGREEIEPPRISSIAPPSCEPRHSDGLDLFIIVGKGSETWLGLHQIATEFSLHAKQCFVMLFRMHESEDLISKKDLLEATGISYGQLYRWKRKGLIPESWFRKKSAFTGQETFFPRQEILERVERIKGMKEDVALSELADLLSPSPSGSPLGMDDLVQKNIVSQATFGLLQESAWENSTTPLVDPIPFGTAFHARLCEKLLEEGSLSREEILLAFHTLEEARGAELSDEPGELLLLRKSGVSFCLVRRGEAVFDHGTRTALEMDLARALADFRWILKGERT